METSESAKTATARHPSSTETEAHQFDRDPHSVHSYSRGGVNELRIALNTDREEGDRYGPSSHGATSFYRFTLTANLSTCLYDCRTAAASLSGLDCVEETASHLGSTVYNYVCRGDNGEPKHTSVRVDLNERFHRIISNSRFEMTRKIPTAM